MTACCLSTLRDCNHKQVTKSRSYEPETVCVEHYNFIDLLLLEVSSYAVTEVFYLVAMIEFEGDISHVCNIPDI